MSDSKGNLKELLFEDYRYVAELFKNSEARGETRLNIFISLVTLILGGLISIATGETFVYNAKFNLLVLMAFSILLGLGCLIQKQIKTRNQRSDEYKEILNYIRQKYLEINDYKLDSYDPFNLPTNQNFTPKKRKFGGLYQMIVTINSFIGGGVIFSVLIFLKDSLGLIGWLGNINLGVAIFAVLCPIFILVFSILCGYGFYLYHKNNQRSTTSQSSTNFQFWNYVNSSRTQVNPAHKLMESIFIVNKDLIGTPEEIEVQIAFIGNTDSCDLYLKDAGNTQNGTELRKSDGFTIKKEGIHEIKSYTRSLIRDINKRKDNFSTPIDRSQIVEIQFQCKHDDSDNITSGIIVYDIQFK